MYNTKNYMAQGGDELVINGKLTIGDGATVTGLPAPTLTPATASALGGVKVGTGLDVTADGTLSVTAPLTPAANQAASTATTVADLKTDLNTLLAALKTAGIMVADVAG